VRKASCTPRQECLTYASPMPHLSLSSCCSPEDRYAGWSICCYVRMHVCLQVLAHLIMSLITFFFSLFISRCAGRNDLSRFIVHVSCLLSLRQATFTTPLRLPLIFTGPPKRILARSRLLTPLM
jgi:hypothetical protein